LLWTAFPGLRFHV